MKCIKCGRELKDPESIARGIGPVCWQRTHKKSVAVKAEDREEIVIPGQMTIFDIIGEDDDGGTEGTGNDDEGGAGEPGD